MAPADLTTEQWEVTVDSIEKSIDILFVFFEDMIKNPDPRVKWAMQIMDQEGEVCTTHVFAKIMKSLPLFNVKKAVKMK